MNKLDIQRIEATAKAAKSWEKTGGLPERCELTASEVLGLCADALSNRNLLDRSRHEITNLMDKLGRKEPAGWEGVQRRILLMSDLNMAVNHCAECEFGASDYRTSPQVLERPEPPLAE